MQTSRVSKSLACGIVMLFMISALTSAVKDINKTTNGSPRGWMIETVDNTYGTGDVNSIKLDSSNNPHIAYTYDYSSSHELRYASWTGSTWSIETVVTAPTNNGFDLSLALDSNDYPHICYQQYTSQGVGNLKYAAWDGSSWDLQNVDTSGDTGYYPSIAVDSSGVSYISYWSLSLDALRCAKWTGSSWSKQTVENNIVVLGFTSIAVDSSSSPQISYSYGAPYIEYLKYAKWTGSSWSIQIVDSNGKVGAVNAIALDSNGNPQIAYSDDYPNYDLKYAKWTGSSWSTETVDTYGWEGDAGISIAVGSNGNPQIAYSENNPNNNLKYAAWTGSDWDIETVSSNNGNVVGIALDSNDVPHMSYEQGNYLMHAKQTGNTPPNTPNVPSGPTTRTVGQAGTYSTSTSDPDGDQVQYRFDWDASGSHDYSGWTSLVPSGQSASLSHSWGNTGTYIVKAQARDQQGASSTWSGGLTVVVGGSLVAEAGGPYYGDVGVPVTFDASGSQGSIVGYRWDWTNDGTWDTGWLTTPITTYTYQSEFSGMVHLQVKDNSRNTADDTADITIYNMNKNLLAYWNFDNGDATDATGHGWNGVIHGSPQKRPGVNGNCLYFSGHDWITVNNFWPLKDGSFTICFWVKPHTIKYPKDMCVFDNSDLRVQLTPEFNGNYIDDMLIKYYQSYHASGSEPADYVFWGYNIYDGGPNNGKVCFESDQPIKLNMVPRWDFVVCEYDEAAPANEKNKLYIDGYLEGSAPTYDNVWPNYNDFYMAMYSSVDPSDSPDQFKGYLDDVRVYQRVLSQDEINFLHDYPIGNNNIPPDAVIDDFSPYAVRTGDTVTFHARSHDYDGSIAQYQWDFNGDMNFEWSSTTTGTATHSYSTPGEYLATFRTIDNRGKASPMEYERVVVFKSTANVWVPGTYFESKVGHSTEGLGTATFVNKSNIQSGSVSTYTDLLAFPIMDGSSYAMMCTPSFVTTTRATYLVDVELLSVGGKETLWTPVGASIGETGGQIAHFQYNENTHKWGLKHGITKKAIDPWLDSDLVLNIILEFASYIPGLDNLFTLQDIYNCFDSIFSPSELLRAMQASDTELIHGSWRITLDPGQHYLEFGPYSYVGALGFGTGKAFRCGQVRFIAADTTNLPPNNDLIFTTLCPVSLNVTDPNGRYVNLTNSTIPDARNIKIDLNFDGVLDNYVEIPNPLQGEYIVHVIPDTNASGNDTFSMIANADGGSYTIVDNVSIENISTDGYGFNYSKPVIPQNLVGPDSQRINNVAEFSASTTHPNNDELYYMWDWGDGNFTDWLGPYASGENVQTSYTWHQPGFFNVKVKAKSVNGPESNWSTPHQIEITMPFAFLFGLVQNIQETDNFTYCNAVAVLFLSSSSPYIAFYQSNESMAIKNDYVNGKIIRNISLFGETFNVVFGRFHTSTIFQSASASATQFHKGFFSPVDFFRKVISAMHNQRMTH